MTTSATPATEAWINMRWMRASIFLVMLGCTGGNGDVVGPFTGAPHRFVVDAFTLPHLNNDARALGDDLNGDRSVDNQGGMVIASLAQMDGISTHAADIIASGVIASYVEIDADDLTDTPRTGVTYYGHDGDAAVVMGGALVSGSLRSNRTRTTGAPGLATLVLPVFADADPITVTLQAAEIDLDADGEGGFAAVIRGGLDTREALDATAVGMLQMLATAPADHMVLARLLATGHDGVVTAADIENNSLIRSLEAADIAVDLDGHSTELLSLGVGFHLKPCDAGGCTPAAAVDRCHDRVLDQDETDVDCGGATCMPCGGGFACSTASDCQLPACDGGRCRLPTCTDGVADGFESGVDCGGACLGCAGDTCSSDSECQSGTCDISRVCR